MKNPEVTFEVKEHAVQIKQWVKRGAPTPLACMGKDRVRAFVRLVCLADNSTFCYINIANRPASYKIARSLRDRLARQAVMYLRAKYG